MTEEKPKDEIQQLGNKAKKALNWSFSITALWQVLSWVFTLVTAKLLLPSDYGFLTITEIIIPYLMMLTTLRLDNWLIQKEHLDKKDEESVFFLVISLSIISVFIAFMLAPAVAWFYSQPSAQLLIQASSSIIFLRALQLIPEARLRRNLDFKTISLISLVSGLIRGLLQIFLAYKGFSYWSLLIGYITQELLNTVAYIVLGGLPRRFAIVKSTLVDAIKFGTSASLATVFWILSSTIDKIIVGKFLGIEALGLYTMAMHLTDLPISKLNAVISPILTPVYSRIKTDKVLLAQSFLDISFAILLIISPILVGMLITSHEIINIFLDKEWNNMESYFNVLCLVGIYKTIVSNSSPILFAINLPKKVLNLTVTSTIVMVIGFYVGVQLFGINGVFFSWLVIYPIVGSFYSVYILKNVLGFNYRKYLFNVFPPIFACLIMLVFSKSLDYTYLKEGNIFILFVLKGLLGAFIYLAVMRLLFFEQIKKIISFIRT